MNSNKKHLTRCISLCSFVLISQAIIGCEATTERSVNIATSDIYLTADLQETSGSGRTKVTVNMREGGAFGKSIELSEGEFLSVQFNDQELTLVEDTEFLEIDYDANVNTNGEAGEFVVTLHRADGSIIPMSVMMPETFSLTNPKSGDHYDESDMLTANWSPSVEDGRIYFHGHIACTTIDEELDRDIDNENETWSTSDTGSFIVPLMELANNMRREADFEDEVIVSTTPCDFDLKVYRENSASLSTVFHSGSDIRARKQLHITDMELNVSAF